MGTPAKCLPVRISGRIPVFWRRAWFPFSLQLPSEQLGIQLLSELSDRNYWHLRPNFGQPRLFLLPHAIYKGQAFISTILNAQLANLKLVTISLLLEDEWVLWFNDCTVYWWWLTFFRASRVFLRIRSSLGCLLPRTSRGSNQKVSEQPSNTLCKQSFTVETWPFLKRYQKRKWQRKRSDGIR